MSRGPIGTPGIAGHVPPAHTETLVGEIAKSIPMGRLGTPEEIAKHE